ncbi:DUF3693 domain-containing protein [Xanthomonas citri]|uniref:DUF3693 domain-containing protein n=1 Tax=Xanthomonas citri TaxID=346 RepID=UPI000C517C91|nr:DUF3693 domain-containing protein [Xanthomonas citri]ATS80436.1 hypothetical protein XcfCFBP7767P_12145 [Xanthomonas citri pv. phaseoli var. fuscans]
MDTLNKLLDQAKQMCSRDSDNCLAQTLGLQRAAVSKWRHGGKISPEELAKVIVLAQADPGIAVLVLAEQADDATTKKLWGPLWDRLSPVTTVIGALALVAIGMHAGAHEALLAALSPVVITDPLYIMRNRVRAALMLRGRLLWLWITSLLPSRSPSDKEIAA